MADNENWKKKARYARSWSCVRALLFMTATFRVKQVRPGAIELALDEPALVIHLEVCAITSSLLISSCCFK